MASTSFPTGELVEAFRLFVRHTDGLWLSIPGWRPIRLSGSVSEGLLGLPRRAGGGCLEGASLWGT